MNSEESSIEKQAKCRRSTSISNSLSSVSSSNKTASINCPNMAKIDPKPQGEGVRSTLTLDDLIDDCLVPVLARVPFHEQFTSLPLTCKRWYALLAAVHLKRTSLVVWDTKKISTELPHSFIQSINRFHLTSPVSSERYVKYTANLLNATDCQQTSSQADYHYRKSLDIGACRQIGEHFPNLKHLSLMNVDINPETLLALLERFPTQLESFLLYEPVVEPSPGQILMKAEKGTIIGRILTLIDGMPLLRQLGLSVCRAFLSNLSLTLSSVLPRLEELSLSNAYLDVYPILLRLDERKLRRLSLECAGLPNLQMFSHLLAAKPALRALTHLSLSGCKDLSQDRNHTFRDELPLLVVEHICSNFPLLEYLYINVTNPLRDLLPHLCKLKNLLHLQIQSYSSEILDGLVDGCSSTSTELSQCGIPSLQVLIIDRPMISVSASPLAEEMRIMSLDSESTHSLAPLRDLFPQLRQLYLECYLRCSCLEKGDIFSLPCDRPVGCTCKSRIIKCLNSFEHIPKIQLSNTVTKLMEDLN